MKVCLLLFFLLCNDNQNIRIDREHFEQIHLTNKFHFFSPFHANLIKVKSDEADNSKFVDIAHFEPSQRGSVVLYYEGKRFTRDGMFQDSINWRCCYFRDKCRARAITKEFNGITKVRVTNAKHTCTPKRVPKA